jgi:hypothetical protein
MALISRNLYTIIGMICGFVLIDYGFSFLTVGLPGAREITSQLVGVNLLVGGSATVFITLYYLLKSTQPPTSKEQVSDGKPPDVGVELVVEEQTPPQFRFYRNIEYVGYIFTAIGLLSAADLVLQVFIYRLYNETRWWIEVLLVVFGVLGFAIFGSIGRIGEEEERALVQSTALTTFSENASPIAQPVGALPETLELQLINYTKSPGGDYEHKLSPDVYDMFHVQSDMVTVWREDRSGKRSVYLAGPYELVRELLQEKAKRSEQIMIGILSLTAETSRDLLAMQDQTQQVTT